MKLLKLTKGKQTLIDDCDYEQVSKFKWRVLHRKYSKNYYVVRNHGGIILHREILGLTKGDGKEVDHINHNGLDNRRINLRVCTHKENEHNQYTQNRLKSSKFKGVDWHKNTQKFRARIKFNSKKIHLGFFFSEIEAAKAYDEAAVKYFGEFAYLNFQTPIERGFLDNKN